jgi:hypothetical protein
VSWPLTLRAAGRIATEMIIGPQWTPLDARELDAAIVHHDWILDELALLLRAGARVQSEPDQRQLSDEDRDEQGPINVTGSGPGRALLDVLDGHPRHGSSRDADPTDILSELSDGVGGWRNLNRVLVVAAYDWSEVVGPVPDEVRRGVLADIAALTDAVALLQQDLADKLDLLGHRLGLAQQLRAWSRKFEVAASAALTQTLRTSTKDNWTPPAVSTPRVLPVVRAQQIPSAAFSLARMLHDPHLRLDSESALELIVVHAMTTALVGDFLRAAGRSETALLLKQHSEKLLSGAETARKRVWSKMPHSHDHPLTQARELYWATGRALRNAGTRHELVQIATDYATLTPAITAGLRMQVRGAASRYDWVYLEELHWQAAGRQHLSTLVYALERGYERIKRLGPGVVRADTSRSHDPRAAHRVLAAAKADLRRPAAARRPPPPPAPGPTRPR